MYHENRHSKATYSLGIDPARMGKDFSAFVILEKKFFEEEIKLIYMEELSHKALTETIGRAVYLDSRFGFDKIYVDSTGLGSGVFDMLKEKLGGKVVDTTFSIQSKQDIFHNLKLLMQQGKLMIPRHKKLIFELMSIQYQMTIQGNMKIFHDDKTHDDLVCALALAAQHFRVGKKCKRSYTLV